jgi:DNA repair exonuclease SbcCD ATPase subunit
MLAEHPEIGEALLQKPEKVIEFLDREGLLAVIETKRVTGLQAAKDKELAEMSAKYKADLAAMKERHEAALAENDAAQAAALAERDERIKNLQADNDAKRNALAEAQAKVEQLSAKCAEAEKALAETQAALAAETERYREQVGLALQQPENLRTAAEIAKDANLSPAEKSRLLSEGKYR